MPNNAPIVPCPVCGVGFRLNVHPGHVPSCLPPNPTLSDLYSVGRVAAEGECHVWRANHNGHGYGLLSRANAARFGVWYAHRMSLTITTGAPIPRSLKALHHCDNPPCVRPEHLYLGTMQQNMQDMIQRGRGAGQIRPGESLRRDGRRVPEGSE